MWHSSGAAGSSYMAKSPTSADAIVGAKVRFRRKQLGLSQEKLGELTGVTFQQIQKYEKGSNRIGASRLLQFAKELSVPPGYFFEGILDVPDGDTVPPALLSMNGVADLVRHFAAIQDPLLRRAVVDLARNLRRAESSSAAIDVKVTKTTRPKRQLRG
jgi:transcriptional regulator with XRE-family HTH domain